MGCVPASSAQPSDGATSQLYELAGPLLHSTAFVRLSEITFLGILSPRFSCAGDAARDGTRGDHSVGVATIAVEVMRRLGLSVVAQRYAAAWGLLHDVGTWPLSHTSEPAFARRTGVSARRLREMMILGDGRLPSRLSVDRALAEMGVSPNVLLGLMRGSAPGLSIELDLLGQLIRSRVTPDTLEGMWRAGRAYGVPVPEPARILGVLERSLFDVVVAPGGLRVVGEFWRRKGRVYGVHINAPDAVRRDSAWSGAIEQAFAGISLGASLELSEDDVVRAVRRGGVQVVDTRDRYKPPHVYIYCARSARRFPGRAPISALNRVLLKTSAGGCPDGS